MPNILCIYQHPKNVAKEKGKAEEFAVVNIEAYKK